MRFYVVRNTILLILLISMGTTLYGLKTILYTGVNNRQLVGEDTRDDWDLSMGNNHIGLAFNNSDTMLFPIIESGLRFENIYISIPTKLKYTAGNIVPSVGMTVSFRYPHHEEDNGNYYYSRSLSNFDLGFNIGLDYVNKDKNWFVGLEFYRGFLEAYTYDGDYNGDDYEIYFQTMSISIGLMF